MVKRLLRIIAATVLLLTLALTASVFWLLHSESAARWLVRQALARAPQTSVAGVEGTLAAGLSLSGLRSNWPGGSLTIEELVFRWTPGELLTGKVHLRELNLSGVSVALVSGAAPAAGKPFVWPQVSGWPLRLVAMVDRFEVQRLEVSEDGLPLFALKSARAALEWRAGIVSVQNLALTDPELTVAGEARFGLAAPSLAAALSGRWSGLPEPVGGWSVRLDLREGKGGPAGDFLLELNSPAAVLARLQGKAGFAPGRLLLTDLRLERPGRPGWLEGQVKIALDGSEPLLQIAAHGRDLDLAGLLGYPTRLSGTLELAGNAQGYAGRFDLVNRGSGWQQLAVAGELRGDLDGVAATALRGSWLRGTLGGSVRFHWSDPAMLDASLQLRGLDPALVASSWPGRLNADLQARWQQDAAGVRRLDLQGRLLPSRLVGYDLAGPFHLVLAGDDLIVSRLELRGDGIVVTGAGRLDDAVRLSLQVADLQRLHPAAAGSLSGNGWVRRRAGRWSGAAELQGDGLRWSDGTVAGWQAQLAVAEDGDLRGRLHGQEARFGPLRLTTLDLDVSGKTAAHRLKLAVAWPGGHLDATASGAYAAARWAGRIETLAGEDADGDWQLREPAALLFDRQRLKVASVQLSGRAGEMLEFGGEWRPDGRKLTLEGQWRELNLTRLGRLLGMPLRGRSHGKVKLAVSGGRPALLNGSAEIVAGEVPLGKTTLKIDAAQVSADVEADRLIVQGKARLATGGEISLRLRSAAPTALAWPAGGSFSLAWHDLPLQSLPLQPPAGVSWSGALRGEIDGEWSAGGRFGMAGSSTLSDGLLQWRERDHLISLPLQKLTLQVEWRGEELQGRFGARLGPTGVLDGEFRLPLPARWPMQLERTRELSAAVHGTLVEEGLLSALFPGSIIESRGQIQLRLALHGTLSRPLLDGEVVLTGVGGYLPAAGIRLVDGRSRISFAGTTIRVEQLSVKSGGGELTGEGVFEFAGLELREYHGRVRGEKVLLINLPELQVTGSPELNFSGTPELLKVEGEMRLPKVLVRGRKSPPPKRESADVVVLAAPGPLPPPRRTLGLDATVRLTLGPEVKVDMAGIDARLGGSVLVHATGWTAQRVTGSGRISVESGSYSTYGVRLQVEKGTLVFTGGAIDQPTIDVLALRKAGDVKAGVRVGGTPRALKVVLHAEPAMPDTDILSYIVFGRPLGSDTSQLSLLSAAARALLARGDSEVLQDSMRRRLGIDVIDVENADGTLESSIITVGKYLTPDLYISIGHGVFSGSDRLQMRYDLSRRWQVESNVGEESGADLYYKLEFH